MALTEDESRDWGGWERVESLVRGLASGTSTPTAQTWGGHLPPPAKMQPGGSGPESAAAPLNTRESSASESPKAAGKSKNQDRISIANILM